MREITATLQFDSFNPKYRNAVYIPSTEMRAIVTRDRIGREANETAMKFQVCKDGDRLTLGFTRVNDPEGYKWADKQISMLAFPNRAFLCVVRDGKLKPAVWSQQHNAYLRQDGQPMEYGKSYDELVRLYFSSYYKAGNLFHDEMPYPNEYYAWADVEANRNHNRAVDVSRKGGKIIAFQHANIHRNPRYPLSGVLAVPTQYVRSNQPMQLKSGVVDRRVLLAATSLHSVIEKEMSPVTGVVTGIEYFDECTEVRILGLSGESRTVQYPSETEVLVKVKEDVHRFTRLARIVPFHPEFTHEDEATALMERREVEMDDGTSRIADIRCLVCSNGQEAAISGLTALRHWIREQFTVNIHGTPAVDCEALECLPQDFDIDDVWMNSRRIISKYHGSPSGLVFTRGFLDVNLLATFYGDPTDPGPSRSSRIAVADMQGSSVLADLQAA